MGLYRQLNGPFWSIATLWREVDFGQPQEDVHMTGYMFLAFRYVPFSLMYRKSPIGAQDTPT